MDEREDITEQHDVDQSQEPGSEGYPEEQPGSGDDETSSDEDRSGAPRQDEQSRQGGDATGNPGNAG